MEDIEDYKKAGRIAAEALQYGKDLIKKDAKVLDICDKIEEKIAALGGHPAFPVQISLNEAAAHYCPEEDDKVILSDQIVCLDVGVHVNGCIGDNAVSVDLSGKNDALVKASRQALDNAIKVIKPGIKLREIGKIINDTITGYGFKPIYNLSGHGLDSYNIHSSPTVPNYDNGDETELEKGQIIAIEPFATTGAGMIQEKGDPSVFVLFGKKPVRISFVRDIQKEIEKYNGLPFTTRWLTRKFNANKIRYALSQFKQLEILKEYPPLVEKQQGLVSQAEHTIMVDDESVVLTKA